MSIFFIHSIKKRLPGYCVLVFSLLRRKVRKACGLRISELDASTDKTIINLYTPDPEVAVTDVNCKKNPTLKPYLIGYGKCDPTGIEQVNNYLSTGIHLNQKFQNPFFRTSRIRYELQNQTHDQLLICNSTGKKASTLVDADQASGVHSVLFNAKRFEAGIFFYSLTTIEFRETEKMLSIEKKINKQSA